MLHTAVPAAGRVAASRSKVAAGALARVTSLAASPTFGSPRPLLGLRHRRPGSSVACRATGTSGSVIDAPSTTAPGLEKGTRGSTKRPPIYKLMLHNDNYNRREYVVKILVKVVEGLTKDDAVNVMLEAHETGVAMVLACPQDEAEQYCESLRINGLSSSIEPGC